MTHLWEMDTLWFEKPEKETIHSTYTYKSWSDFQEYKPYKIWKPYILSSWSWKTIHIDDNGCKPTKRDPKKHILDCSKMLRIHPSSYDVKKDTIPKGTNIEMLQIVFLSPSRFEGMHRVEIQVRPEDEESIRDWLKRHMPNFWKI